MKANFTFFLFLLILPLAGLLPGCKKDATLPSVETSEILAPTTTSIYIRGRVTGNSGSDIIERGFVGCTIPDPSLQSYTHLTEDGGGGGYFERTISDLTSGTWYFKAYAINETGVGYGEEKMINTIEDALLNKFTMEQDDYAFIVEIDPIPHPAFDEFGYYYGASSFFLNFDFRLQTRRLNKDEEGNYFDPDLAAIYENHGAEAAITEMFERLLHDGLIELLRLRYPNAQPKYKEYEIEYVIEFETFHENWIRRNPVATYRCTASGNPPDFELIEWSSF
ncbi:MAG: hypothetical protein EA393_06125 [Bacteroidetes bacterium]|nr:MAG: hypothetical protein EA393_06125 [Bacteroidota bacterium]